MLRCYGYMYIYNRHHPRNYQVELAMSWGLEGCNSWGLLTDSFGIQLAQWIAASICGKLLCWMVFTYMFLAPKCCGVLFFSVSISQVWENASSSRGPWRVRDEPVGDSHLPAAQVKPKKSFWKPAGGNSAVSSDWAFGLPCGILDDWVKSSWGKIAITVW